MKTNSIFQAVLFCLFAAGCEDHAAKDSVVSPVFQDGDIVTPRLREDMIESNMSMEKVRSLLGKPERAEHEEESGLVAWTYYEHEENLKTGLQLGGLTVVFKDGRVYKVLPIEVISREIP